MGRVFYVFTTLMEVLTMELRLPLFGGLLITLMPLDEMPQGVSWNPWELDGEGSDDFDQDGHLGRDGEWW
jgi:hypothetical protein